MTVGVICEIIENIVKTVTFSKNCPLSNKIQNKIKNNLIGLEYNKDNLVDKITQIIKTDGCVVVD